MAVAKKKPVKKTVRVYSWSHVIFGVVLLLALGVGLITSYRAGATRQLNEMPPVANGTILENSRNNVAKQYLEASTANCANDTANEAERVTTFYKYLRVNLHNDRAVIRGCNDKDTLLAYIDGRWQKTDVQLNLDDDANLNWQRACDVEDITRTETKARPENADADKSNLKVCRGLHDGKNIQIQE